MNSIFCSLFCFYFLFKSNRTAKYRIRISEESLRLLKDFGRSCKNLTDVIKEKILIESK